MVYYILYGQLETTALFELDNIILSYGRHGDKKSHKKILSISLLGTGLAFIPQAFVFSIYLLFPVRILIGAFVAGILPSTQTLLVRQTVENKRGGVLGLCQAFSLLGTALGPIVGGSIAAAFGIRASFLATAFLLLLTWYYARGFIKETETATTVTME
ncbi:MAG: MFS transporter [Candidatus Firestonebacteria bacterium]|nr:MFS transporter [Candidatus Firestonebacteria bacterium]